MGAKTRRRFGHMLFPEPEPVPTRCTGRKNFRLLAVDDQEDEEYCGDDEREVCNHEIMPVHSGPGNWLEARDDDRNSDDEPSRRKQKYLELTELEKEKAALLAQPDPWRSQATDEEELRSLLALAFTVCEEICAPVPNLVEWRRDVSRLHTNQPSHTKINS